MKIFAAVIALFAAAAAAQLSPEGILRDIKLQGAKAVVDRLWNDGDWDRVMDRVDAGDARWIALVPQLAPGTDAGTAEDLPIALAFALPKNPGAVLALLGRDGFPADEVCGAPFIEDTVKDIPAYLRQAETAVLRVRDPALSGAKQACLAELKKAAARPPAP
jgi:hypothetical protein